MSGAITATTIAALVGAGAAVGGTAYSIYSGQQAAGQQKRALNSQEGAQKTAEAATLSQARKSETAMNAANQKMPDIAAILQRAAQAGKGGVGSTMLTGSAGVNPGGLNLGKTTLLGG